MRQLPTLEGSRTALETCTFCPKLCRTACPVSNADASETLTPWGKMSTAYFAAHGDVPLSASFARTSLACTGCHACRGMCDHGNDVAGTLLATRAALASQGALPEATQVAARFPDHAVRTAAAVAALGSSHGPDVRPDAATALLIGCTYARSLTPEAHNAVSAVAALTGEPVALIPACCGLPLLLAGDVAAFRRQADAFARSVSRHPRLVVVDPGCAVALRLRYPEFGVGLAPEILLFVDVAARGLAKLTPPRRPVAVRYHDPCQLGRGLGAYEAPRRVLAHVTGRAPDEFVAHGSFAACSGGGGLLPVTMPGTARRIAAMRQDDHAAAGGGEIVTACASSLRSLRAAGPAPVTDLVTWVARAVS